MARKNSLFRKKPRAGPRLWRAAIRLGLLVRKEKYTGDRHRSRKEAERERVADRPVRVQCP